MHRPDQCAEQVNFWATIVDGLGKRPGTEHVNQIDAGPLGDQLIHYINRDVTERYIVLLSNGDLKVFDQETGEAKAVSFPAGKSYLTATSPSEDFALVTVADYTFVVNKTVECKMDVVGADNVADPLDYAWLNTRVDPWGASLLYKQYTPNTFYGTGVTASVQAFEDLPDTAPQGALYRIKGTTESLFTSYYVVKNGGVWDETVAPNIANAIDPLTMPHALVRNADGTFTFAPFSWAPRRVGDEDTNPAPTFIGRKINDVFFSQNRLSFLVDENVVMSVAGDFGNFFRTTVLDFIDSDVIDVASSETNVNILRYAVPFREGVMLFSGQTQFALTYSEEGLAAGNIQLHPTTRYEMNLKVRPRMVGRDIYFLADTANYSRMYEYFASASTGLEQASDVTAHVPRYIPKGASVLAGSPNLDALFVVTESKPNVVYVYQFFWVGDQKAQSAWHQWDFADGDSILAMEVVDEYLYMVISRSTGTSIERINLTSGYVHPDIGKALHLDRQMSVSGTYLPVEDKTEYTLPGAFEQPTFRAVRGSGHPEGVGSLIDPSTYEWPTPLTFKVPGDTSANPVHFGANYTARYTFSEQFMVGREGQAITTGRLILRTFTLYFTDTAFFKLEVAPYGINPTVEEVVPAGTADFTAKTLGVASLKLGEPSYETGAWSFQVYGNSRDATVAVINDTHVSSSFQSAEWEGMYNNRARAY